jgi:tetratricopeptide (TPR) repeat protein
MPELQGDAAEDVVRDHLELGMVGVLLGADVSGAGFLIDPMHVITCAHTVNGVLGRDRHDEEQPGGDLELNFPFADRRRNVKASVVAWCPVGDGHNDIAVLLLKEHPPTGAHPVRLIPADRVTGHRFVAWGFPLENAGEMYAEGVIQRRRGDDRIQVVGTEVTGQAVRRGFSGTAVWDEVLGGVIGMVVAADPDPASKTAYLVPTDVLAEVWPALNVVRPRPMIPAVRVVGERVSAAVDVFRDRVEFRARLRGLVLAREKPIICVTGRRGIGKSGLVARVLADFEGPADMTGDTVGGLAYLSTRTGVGMLDLARIFHALTRLLPQDQGDRLEEQWANAGADALPDLLSALRARNAVLVLDNLDDLQNPDTGELTNQDLITFLTAICRDPHPPIVVTTSQRPIELPLETFGHFTVLEIDDGLDADEAVGLLRQLDADNRAGLHSLPDAELLQAAERVYRIPRGLELLVALMAKHRTATLQRLLDAQDTPEVLLGRLVSEGFHSLDELGRDVVTLLALADTPLPADALPEMLADEHPPDAVAPTVERLAETHMIGFERNSGRARLHPIDSDYVRGTLLADQGKRAALDLRLADWLATQRTDSETWRTSSDVAVQRREIRHRLRAGDGRGAVRTMANIAEFLARHGEGDQLTDVLEQGRRYADTPALRAAYELSRGAVAVFAGSLDEAIDAFGAGRNAAAEAGDRMLTARLDLLLGVALRHAGNAEATLEPLKRASTLPITDQASRAIVVHSVFERGIAACYLGDVAKTEAAAARIETILRKEDPPLWWGHLADLRALIALLGGNFGRALAAVERGIVCYADSPEQDNVGYLVNVRGLVLLAQGRITEAARDFITVREDAAALRYARLEGFAALNLAWTQLCEGNRQSAAATAREAADLLAANRVRETESARALAAACEAAEDATLQRLRFAVSASHGNPDLYQPSDEALADLAAGLGK